MENKIQDKLISDAFNLGCAYGSFFFKEQNMNVMDCIIAESQINSIFSGIKILTLETFGEKYNDEKYENIASDAAKEEFISKCRSI